MYLYTIGIVVIGVALWKRPAAVSAGRLLIAWIFGQDSSKTSQIPVEVKPVEPEEEEDPNLIILYGSQSGTAETLAFELETEAKSYSFVPKVVDLEDFAVDDLATTPFVTILIATHGEGEPTDSSEQFWEWIQSDERDDDLLSDVTFAVFGLGNKQYEFFNAMGRGVHKHMKRLGAKELVKLGEGDDDGSLEEDFAEWKTEYWKETRAQFGEATANGGDPEGEVRVKFTPKFQCEYLDDPADPRVKKAQALEHPTDTDPSHPALCVSICENRELRQDTCDGSTMHMEIEADSLPYVTADNLSVAPRNDYKLVAKLIKRLDADPEAVFCFTAANANVKNSFSKPCTIRNALLWYTDITNIPRKAFVSALAQYATADDEEARLLRLTSSEGKEEYQEWMKTKAPSVYDILTEFPSIQIPVEHFLELLPRLQVREYTISSSSKAQPNRIAITYSVVEKTSETGCAGVCTQYLQALRPGKDKVACFVKASSFRFPPNVSTTPIIMLGPGTGVAPMRAFVQEGKHLLSQGDQPLAPWYLFFGCRHKEKDYIYRDELEVAHEEKDGCLTKLYTAFSRDQDEKYYVQDALRDNAEAIWPLVRDQGAYVYVCGATLMGRGVRETFVAMIEKQDNVTTEKAQEVLHSLQDQKRFIQELWG